VNLTYKVYGPDINGTYGGLQGTGGLEATIMDAGGTATGVLNDFFGNGVATISGGSVTWNTTRVGGYGPLPDSAAQPLTSIIQLASAVAWRGHYIDGTGCYHVGKRDYEPISARWMSADPLGFAASTSLYEFAANDPVNNFDPDGRDGFPADAAFHAAPDNTTPAPIPVNFSTVSTVIMSAAGQAFVGTTAGLSSQLAPNSGDAQSVQAGWQIAQSNMAQSAGIDPNNPRFQLATTATSIIGAVTLGGTTAGETADVNVLSGHGGYDPANGTTTIPANTSFTTWTAHGNSISDTLGNAIETGGSITYQEYGDQIAGAKTYLPGAEVPNYTLFPPDGLNIAGNPTTVTNPTNLSQLLSPNQGNVNWAACLNELDYGSSGSVVSSLASGESPWLLLSSLVGTKSHCPF
jgi:RHS repeat-associated protein